MERICSICSQSFELFPDDLLYYQKIGVQEPRMCPQCRAQRRLAFRNERNFYKVKCGLCAKDTISVHSPNKPYPVYCHDCWFGDGWDAKEYAMDYDPGRPFFDQFKELWAKVPKVALMHTRSVNSEYLNFAGDNKDCYLIIESSNNENCIHCYWIQLCKDSVDLSCSHRTQLSYESDGCYDSYKILYCRNCYDCRDSYFLLDCTNCSDCIGCVNLRSKQYYIFNQPYTKEEYIKRLAEMHLDTYEGVEKLRAEFETFAKTQPHKFAERNNVTNSTGTYLANVKNDWQCFHSYEAEDCRYCVHVWRGAKDCMDCDTAGRTAETIYNSMNSGMETSNHICTSACWSSTFIEYCFYSISSSHCFGCTGLRKKSYCILNKQYDPETYEKIRSQIIEELKSKDIYGEFFPPDVSCYGYNESAAQEQFPLTKEQALTQGFKWEDTERGTYGKENGKDIFACAQCTKNFRIIPREFEFYIRLSIPLPRLCPDCRHLRRFTARGPNRLWKRNCAKCNAEFETNYAPDRPEILYCEECYNREII
ncbi:MAG: hypothetical protein A3A33_04055 [Candidatus Yanofskybacteria bacterium RIFCSPLOWO2_01_FULL_49_25]|uniref:Zinc-binding domain-containing protein n=1 Tax=Candidatus Yanofskybacteria bacterium RIFCSPLOWO2_01_FULL_49_25 TaxID=1802701 RepID=A0A1F8GRU1_9BACT|nr:MAG: hypothetical protein A3A33_04055 [Candidatus Yanofskybacteria bacterium RIFCSPLOWO2_01_FULL_49_25]